MTANDLGASMLLVFLLAFACIKIAEHFGWDDDEW